MNERSTKLCDGKVIEGKGRLNDKTIEIDKIQNYFGEAIRNNVENIESKENNIWAIFKPMIQDNSQLLDEQHSLCPKDSWCTYWSYREKHNDQKHLELVFIEVMKPLFLNLSKNELLNRCLQGLTQNQNEAINGLLWSKCPKTKFCGKVKVLLAVSETISHFNIRSGSKVTLLNQLNIDSSQNMLSAVQREDHKCVIIASKKSSKSSQMHRRKLRAKN